MNKIKKFKDFMGVGSNIRRSMNHMIVQGEFKSWFFGKPKSFELHIYYTPSRETIVDVKIYSDSVTIDSLNPDFKLGDNIEVAKNWIEKNNYRITDSFLRN